MKAPMEQYEISKFNPCGDAVEFRAQYPTFKEAWENCPRGDWMLWLAKKLDVDLRIITKAKAKCALTVRRLMKDQRSIDACEVALKFADGLATREELNDAAAAAAAVAYAAYADADADAAYAAADAAYAYADADAAAAYAAAAAAAYVYADAYDARKKNQLETANICREILTDVVFKKLQ